MGVEGAILGLPVYLFVYMLFRYERLENKKRKEMMEKINERARISKILDLGYELLED